MFSGCSVDGDEEGDGSVWSNTQELEQAYPRGCWTAAELGEELELRSMQPPHITWEAPQGGQNLVHEPDDGVLRSLSFNAMVPVGSGPLGEDAADLCVMSVMAPGAINAELGF
jgi:hypothetical protein